MVFTCGMHTSKIAKRTIVPTSTRVQQDVTPPDPVVQRVEAAIPVALGRHVQAALELSRFGEGPLSRAPAVAVAGGVVGSCDHALALTSSRGRDQSRAPSLGRRYAAASTVLWAPRTPARHDPLSPSAYRDRLRPTRPPGRASPVP